MRQSSHLLRLALALGISAFAGLAAEPADTGIDLAAIRARAAAQADDAELLSETARARANAVTTDAGRTSDEGLANGQRYTREAKAAAKAHNSDTFDFDRLVADAGSFTEASLGDAPRFIAFASISMPQPALRQMFADVSAADGVVAFRGFPPGGARAFTAALAKVVEDGKAPPGVGIDPRLFRAFAVEAVPAYVVTASDFELCDGFDCVTKLPPHDRLAGNVTAEHALDTFASGGGPGARLAALHLERLRKERP